MCSDIIKIKFLLFIAVKSLVKPLKITFKYLQDIYDVRYILYNPITCIFAFLQETSSPSSTIQSIRMPGITISRFSNFQHMPATSQATLNSRVPKSAETSMFTPSPIADSTPASIISMASPARITNPISFPKAVSLALKTSKMSSLPNDTNSRVTKPAETSMSTPILTADSTPVQMISMASPIHKANSTFSVRVVSSTSSKTSCQYNDAKCDRAQINHGAMFAFFIALILVFWQNAVLI